MLADFPVAVMWEGERMIVICRDVPTAVFFHGYPNVPPGTQCSEKQGHAERHEELLKMLEWSHELLTRVAVNPQLTLEVVHRLDDSAFEAALSYCYAVGWFTDKDVDGYCAIDGPLGEAARRYRQSFGALSAEILPAPVSVEPRVDVAHMPFVGQIAPNIRQKIRMLAQRCRVRPSALWQSPISETMLDYRLMIEDAIEAQKTQGRPGRPAELYEMGGIEEYDEIG